MGEQVRAAQPRRPNEGVLHLVLQRVGQRTVLQECYFQVPLQVLRPLYLDDVGTAYVYLLSPCGGVVGGDVYSMTVVVEAGARACLTTPSATKLYATSGAPAQQRLDITLQADAVLEYLPEQMIPFAQAVFHQQITVRLGAGACVMLMEIVAPGRVARYLGTFYALVEGTILPTPLVERLHALLVCRRRFLGSATQLAHGGIAVRVLGEDHTTVSQALYEVWDVLRRELLGYPAVVWRK